MTLRTISALGAAVLFSMAYAPAQEKKLGCDDRQHDGRQSRVCEMRESNMAAAGRLNVDAAPNGGIRVSGWSRNEILVRAKVEAWGDSDSEARDRMHQVRVETSGTTVKADGPKALAGWGGNQKWSVSYEIFVPAKIDLDLDTVNGGINVADVRGTMNFKTVNGGVHLARAAGEVTGSTVNGGVSVELSGNTWEGSGLTLKTVNGGVTLSAPASYSAQVKAETTHGGFHCDFDGATMQGKWGPKNFDLKLGSGGPVVKVETVNGGVTIRKKA